MRDEGARHPAFAPAGGPIVWVRVSFASNFADARAQGSISERHGSLPAGWDEFPEPCPHPM